MEVKGHFLPVAFLLLVVAASASYAARATCKKKIPVNKICNNRQRCCAENLVCQANIGRGGSTCKTLPGFPCQQQDQCIKGAVCLRDYCRFQVQYGEDCSGCFKECAVNLMCDTTANHTCRYEVNAAGCNATSKCVSGATCVQNTCKNESKCEWQCLAGYNGNKPCQCNWRCQEFRNCCDDYLDKCAGECPARADVTELLWSLDVNRMSSAEYTVNWQAEVTKDNFIDRSNSSLFTSINDSALAARPTFAAFMALLDNYNILIGTQDLPSSQEWTEIDHFYSLIRSTSIFDALFGYVLCKGHVTSESDFQSKFYDMWFTPYGRSSNTPTLGDSSGFEHVMVGEMQVIAIRLGKVMGLHNWIQFYLEEKEGRLDYYGFVARIQDVPHVIDAQFVWISHQARKRSVVKNSTFFLGSSPEFDMALYTLCAFEAPNVGGCSVRLGGVSVRIQIRDVMHKVGLQIETAYPDIE